MIKIFRYKGREKYYKYNSKTAMLERVIHIGNADTIKKGKVLCCASPVVVKGINKTDSSFAVQVNSYFGTNQQNGVIIKYSKSGAVSQHHNKTLEKNFKKTH